MVYYRLGKYEKAVEDFSRALTLSKVGSRTALFSHVHLGKALARLGRTQAAVENLNQALQLHDYVGGLKRNDIVEIKNLIQDISGGV
jgi:Flp pilus assembly protein TadD